MEKICWKISNKMRIFRIETSFLFSSIDKQNLEDFNSRNEQYDAERFIYIKFQDVQDVKQITEKKKKSFLVKIVVEKASGNVY